MTTTKEGQIQATILELASLTQECPCIDPDFDIEQPPLETWAEEGGCVVCWHESEHSQDCKTCSGTGLVPRIQGLRRKCNCICHDAAVNIPEDSPWHERWHTLMCLGKGCTGWLPVSIPEAAGVLICLPEFLSMKQGRNNVGTPGYWVMFKTPHPDFNTAVEEWAEDWCHAVILAAAMLYRVEVPDES